MAALGLESSREVQLDQSSQRQAQESFGQPDQGERLKAREGHWLFG